MECKQCGYGQDLFFCSDKCLWDYIMSAPVANIIAPIPSQVNEFGPHTSELGVVLRESDIGTIADGSMRLD